MHTYKRDGRDRQIAKERYEKRGTLWDHQRPLTRLAFVPYQRDIFFFRIIFRGSPLRATSFAGGLATATARNVIITSVQSARWNCTKRHSRFPIYLEERRFSVSSSYNCLLPASRRLSSRATFLISSTCFWILPVFFLFLPFSICIQFVIAASVLCRVADEIDIQ